MGCHVDGAVVLSDETDIAATAEMKVVVPTPDNDQ